MTLTKDKKKLSNFVIDGQPQPVQFKETQTVKEGVECDIYSFVDDESKDLAIVTVLGGYKTPLQRVLLGSKTQEGFVSGSGTLTVKNQDGNSKTYSFKDGDDKHGVVVEIGQIMQWEARKDSDLVLFEVCCPPYQDGRFKNLPE